MDDVNEVTSLASVLKSSLKANQFNSQKEIIDYLKCNGFTEVSQAKISRLLVKIGANKVRNASDNYVYQLPIADNAPKLKHRLSDVIVDIQHNGTYIVVHTIAGAAGLITKYIESLKATNYIMGCISSDNTVLVLPVDVLNTEITMDFLKGKFSFRNKV